MLRGGCPIVNLWYLSWELLVFVVCLVAASVALQAFFSSANSFLVWIVYAGEIAGYWVVQLGRGPMLSIVTVEESWDAGLFELIDMSLGDVLEFYVFFDLMISLKTDVIRCLLPRLFKQADMRINGLKTLVHTDWLVILQDLDLVQSRPNWQKPCS